MIPQNIPVNGRIAIVDDQITQAMPLMNLFGKLQIPYIYYSGEVRTLPEEGEAYNDVRLLFLDINLISNTIIRPEELRSTLVGVIRRIISDKNYPYFLVYWSRHEGEYNDLLDHIFREIIPAKAPVAYLSLTKSDFINDDGTLKSSYEEIESQLLGRIKSEIDKFPAYGHLMNWENQIHISADKTLEEIFKLKSYGDDWNSEAGHLFYKLALAYSGKQISVLTPSEQVKSAFFSLNNVFADSLECAIEENLKDKECPALEENKAAHSLTSVLNKKLLLSDDKKPINAPGLVLSCEIEDENADFEELILGCLNMKYITDEINSNNLGISNAQRRNLMREQKNSIKQSCNNIYLVITPVCDFAQNKYVFNKIVKGVKTDASFRKYINHFSEAIYISPVFSMAEGEKDEIIILDFRHLYSFKEMPENGLTPLFRVRQQLLAEIQSKLSRHINRQGILFLE